MSVSMGWTRVPDLDIPAWDLDADSSYYIEKWGLGSFAVYHNAERIPDSTTTYGSLEAAQVSAEIAYRADPDGAAQDPSTTDGLEG
jgi:hypothetical protein